MAIKLPTYCLTHNGCLLNVTSFAVFSAVKKFTGGEKVYEQRQ